MYSLLQICNLHTYNFPKVWLFGTFCYVLKEYFGRKLSHPPLPYILEWLPSRNTTHITITENAELRIKIEWYTTVIILQNVQFWEKKSIRNDTTFVGTVDGILRFQDLYLLQCYIHRGPFINHIGRILRIIGSPSSLRRQVYNISI